MRRGWAGSGLAVVVALVFVVGTEVLKSLIESRIPAGWSDGILWGLAALSAGLALYAGVRARSATAREVRASRRPEPEPDGLFGRIDTLRSGLAASGDLLRELETELSVRAAAVERLAEQVETNRRLVELTDQEAAAVRRLFEDTVAQAQERVVRGANRQQWLFFLAGLLTAVPLGVLGNFTYDLLTR